MVRQLFSSLPPELRNHLYSYTIDGSSPASTLHLSLGSKTYVLPHSTLTIAPVHHGINSLVDLRRYDFLEAEEYYQYLLTEGIELRIAITFTGNVNFFIQSHWDKKVTSHLHNLTKKHPWLRKVRTIDTRILWAPKDRISIPSKKPRPSAGRIASAMLDTISRAIQDPLVARKKGRLSAKMLVKPAVALAHTVNEKEKEQFAAFFHIEGGVEVLAQRRELGIVMPKVPDATPAIAAEQPGEDYLPRRFAKIENRCEQKKEMLDSRKGTVEWTELADAKTVYAAEWEGKESKVLDLGSTNEFRYEAFVGFVKRFREEMGLESEDEMDIDEQF